MNVLSYVLVLVRRTLCLLMQAPAADSRRIIANIERKKDNGIDVYYVLVLKDAGISSGTILSSLGARLHAKNEETD